MRTLSKIVAIASILLIAACATPAPAPSSVGLSHHAFTEAEIAGKTLFVPRGEDNSRYEVKFYPGGTFNRTVYGPRTWSDNGSWSILPNGDVRVKTSKRTAVLSFSGPAADGQFILISSTGAGAPKYVSFR